MNEAIVRRALRKPCRYHPAHKVATCPECASLAEEQRDTQWTRQRKAAHQRYLAERADAPA